MPDLSSGSSGAFLFNKSLKQSTSRHLGFKTTFLTSVGFIGFLVGLYFLGYIVTWIAEPTSPPQNVFLSNITDHQATISWTTEKATKGAVRIGKTLYKDDGDKDLKKQGFYTTHHVTVTNLLPGTTYQFNIYQGAKSVYQGSFFTADSLLGLTTPSPVYGRILGEGKTPIVGAIVYFRAEGTKGKSSLLSALTNIDGRWSIDLGNLRASNLENPFQMSKDVQEEIIVEGGSKGRGKVTASVGEDKPWKDVILR
ncbi:MAG: fibronectin type III domain-containing protein [Candidatus Blackburnbacteria bacterium]|nr:fibronectin type III domain-containing protein [Candidatus Blackburnbacteria bacterium]